VIAVLVVFVLVTAGYAWAFQPSVAGEPEFLLRFAAPHFVLTLYALRELSREGVLVERMKPKWGDLSIGAIAAMLLLMASWAARTAIAPPGTERQAWLLFLYVQLGDPEHIQRSILYSSLLLGITLAEEIIWRGLVTHKLTERFGPRRGLDLRRRPLLARFAPDRVHAARPRRLQSPTRPRNARLRHRLDLPRRARRTPRAGHLLAHGVHVFFGRAISLAGVAGGRVSVRARVSEAGSLTRPRDPLQLLVRDFEIRIDVLHVVVVVEALDEAEADFGVATADGLLVLGHVCELARLHGIFFASRAAVTRSRSPTGVTTTQSSPSSR
jgi:hypothetical protein